MTTVDPSELVHPLSVEDYHRMIEAGVVAEDDRVELLEGVLIEVSPEGPAHATVVARLNRHLVRGLQSDELMVRVGHPITLAPASEPEPDLAIVDTSAGTFAAHPSSAYLVVEVSLSSRRTDRVRKLRVYASAGVPEYWIVDLAERVVEIHRDPRDDGYEQTLRAAPGERIAPRLVELPALDVASLFAA